MGLLNMFDKLDDIVYEPVRVVCDYLRKPMKIIDSHIDVKHAQKMADIENNGKQLDADIEIQMEDAKIELAAKERRLNEEIDNLIAEHDLERRTAVVDAIKQYQIDLSQAVNDCVFEIGKMSLELRERANNMVLEKTKQYTELQDKSKADAKKELKEINEMFADNERVRIKMEDAVMDQMKDMIDTAGSFIKELSEDIKRLNGNIDKLTERGQQLVSEYLKPMTAKVMAQEYTEIEEKKSSQSTP